jgi:GNAT superfamily N-acetyltransferase
MNSRLLEDEGHRNRSMSVADLELRVSAWLRSGEYEAVLFWIGPAVAYALFCREANEVFLRQFFVEREWRRQGIGRAAIAILQNEVWIPPARITLEVLADNAAAKTFWQAVGFRDYAVGMELVP